MSCGKPIHWTIQTLARKEIPVDMMQAQAWPSFPADLSASANVGSNTRVVGAVDALDEPWRSLIEARYWEQLLYREIAERFGWKNRQKAWREVRKAEQKLKENMTQSSQ